jgi:uncharacterized protein (DUF2336 family)
MQHNLGARSGHLDDASRQSLIDELEAAVAQRNISVRADVLRRITDLFIAGSDQYDNEQKTLFDDVMARLVDEIETSAKIAFSQKIARVRNAPTKTSRKLALDDSIEVAGPVLSNSDQLDEETLIVGARTKSQEHLLAISQRKILSEIVTDVLVERGDHKVVVSTAGNSGARFSDHGYSSLVSRSGHNPVLALTVWSRTDVPRGHLLTLFKNASAKVQAALETADHTKASMIRDLVRQASDQIQRQTRERSENFIEAQSKVQAQYDAGLLDERALHKYADGKEFDETTIALSLMSNLPIGAIERIFVNENSDQILLVAKSIGLSWETTRAILIAQTICCGRSFDNSVDHFARFNRLKPETVKTVMQFYRLRERSSGDRAN